MNEINIRQAPDDLQAQFKRILDKPRPPSDLRVNAQGELLYQFPLITELTIPNQQSLTPQVKKELTIYARKKDKTEVTWLRYQAKDTNPYDFYYIGSISELKILLDSYEQNHLS